MPPSATAVSHSQFSIQTACRVRLQQSTQWNSLQDESMFLLLYFICRQRYRKYNMHQYIFTLCFELFNAKHCRCALWLHDASSASFCTRDAHKRFVPLCMGAVHIIILLRNERLLIAFFVLSYISYVAASLKKTPL